MAEIWKTIDNFPNYEISNLGKIKSIDHLSNRKSGKQFLRKGKLRKISIKPDGYSFIQLWNEYGVKCLLLHRLLAIAFIPNPNNYPLINHIDCNPKNNSIENLEWCTSKMNSQHALKLGRSYKGPIGKIGKLNSCSIPILQFDLKMNFIREWNSANCIERELNFNPRGIRANLKGRTKKAYGFIWKYKDNSLNLIKY